MTRTVLGAVLLLLGVAFTRVETQNAAQPAAAPSRTPITAEKALIDRYCITCHNQRAKIGGLVLEGVDVSAAGREPQTWEKIVRKVRTGMMPPSGAPRPDRAALDAFAASIETAIDSVARTAPNPGAPALHRLNRAEYGNAVRDLLDLPIDAAKLLPGDDSSGEGFDNMASTLSVSPALMQAVRHCRRTDQPAGDRRSDDQRRARNLLAAARHVAERAPRRNAAWHPWRLCRDPRVSARRGVRISDRTRGRWALRSAAGRAARTQSKSR
jgi:mono/diheme cytochrome c family protein